MLASIAQNQPTCNPAEWIESTLRRIHAPMGLDLGGTAPADIALSVIAEIQQTLHHASAKSLHELRGHARAPLAFPRNASIA